MTASLYHRESFMLLAVFQDAEKGTVTPALPQARQDAFLPELRSRFAKILDVPRGRSQSLLAQGWVGEISVRLRFVSPAASLDDLFKHPHILCSNGPDLHCCRIAVGKLRLSVPIAPCLAVAASGTRFGVRGRRLPWLIVGLPTMP